MNRHKGPGRDRSSALAIGNAERQSQWLELRKSGMTYAEIASRFNVAPGTVHDSVTRALKAIRSEPAEELFNLELERLDKLLRAVWKRAVGDTLAETEEQFEAIEAARKILADRRKLLGLDAPVKVETTSSIQTEQQFWTELRSWLLSPTPELVSLLEECGWSRHRVIDTEGEET